MSKYTAPSFRVEKSAAEISDKFADLTVLKGMLDKLPESERQKVGDVEFEPDSITIATKQVGNVKFRVTDRSEKQVKMVTEGSPLPIHLDIDLLPVDAATDVTCGIEVDLPAMLRPMVAPHLNQAVGMLSDVIKKAIG